ncbi:hypothetical protein EJ04DRAFT_570151 [Polyplosphaeria fusca]|uniref:Uncharacterized protein n=1 Tax=Polyplosphaeria fusca TaxID=682080 RepID=A0A9P4QMQ7_9PLEO|nr:hypothetical protein EJ04DRAFT_570151 [Polyplosphaeria fusca]
MGDDKDFKAALSPLGHEIEHANKYYKKNGFVVAIGITVGLPVLIIWTSQWEFVEATKSTIAQISTALFLAWMGFCVARGYTRQILAVIAYSVTMFALPMLLTCHILPSVGYDVHWSIIVLVYWVASAIFIIVCGKTLEIEDKGQEYMVIVLSYEAVFIGCLVAVLSIPSSELEEEMFENNWGMKYQISQEALDVVFEMGSHWKVKKQGSNILWRRIFDVWFWSERVMMTWIPVLVFWADWEWLKLWVKGTN